MQRKVSCVCAILQMYERWYLLRGYHLWVISFTLPNNVQNNHDRQIIGSA